MNDDEEGEPPLLHAFGGYGIELEYMLVDRSTLAVKPLADRLLHAAAGQPSNDVDRGLLGWSNELVLHVIEIKNQRPIASLSLLPEAFLDEVQYINGMLEKYDAQLMPTAMHPWMDPKRETRLWPHDNDAIYKAYARIFDSQSHGWANLQSMHINLPFADDREFARLHAAARLVLPILPALAASSPIANGAPTGWADYRMRVYCDNAEGFPAITGMVVPETITSRAAYESRILEPMYQAIAPQDPDGVLQHEWLNSRGAIARFDRNAIEIRVIDTQESPRVDLAIAAAARSAIRSLYRAEHSTLEAQQEMPTAALAKILQDCIREAERAVITDANYLRLLGFPGNACDARELWWHLVERMQKDTAAQDPFWREPLRNILDHGPLARRILAAAGNAPSRGAIEAVYRELCGCLQEGRMFLP
ncbi:glutamate--cysteine ligase [Oxalobacteraceae bacterium OM1]|nr:glutamate--cysteine ligase [Oxalobacteraceae bacterium OM1]